MTSARTMKLRSAPGHRWRSSRGCALAVVLMSALNAGDVSAQRSGPVEVTIEPARPAQGSLFTVQVAAPAGSELVNITGEFAGERLHFEAVGRDVFRAIAALPIDATGTAALPLSIARKGESLEFLTVDVPVATGDYRLEKLTVAPRYGSPPDSATQARIRSDQQKAAEVSRRSHDTPRLWAGALVSPRETRVTSNFGDGREFNGQVQSRHMGLDLAGPSGEPVVAAARGVVALVDTFHLAGNVVYIDHGAGLITAYFHLSRQDVVQGDTVVAGQQIGLVGATGRVTGPHLHWVVRYGSVTVDPRSLLALAAVWGVTVGPDSEDWNSFLGRVSGGGFLGTARGGFVVPGTAVPRGGAIPPVRCGDGPAPKRRLDGVIPSRPPRGVAKPPWVCLSFGLGQSGVVDQNRRSAV